MIHSTLWSGTLTKDSPVRARGFRVKRVEGSGFRAKGLDGARGHH